MNDWKNCKKILCIRADNMGDVIMSVPAIRALKETFGCHITLLTSTMGGLIKGCISEIDEWITFNAPWIKTSQPANAAQCFELVQLLKQHQFDGAVIFTVYSQSPLPAALTCLMAGIPLRAACCRENPYDLLTDWLPDEEPYEKINHQVERDLRLVNSIGTVASKNNLSLTVTLSAVEQVRTVLEGLAIDITKPYIILHPGVSEEKRQYPVSLWIEAGKLLQQYFDCPVLITGAVADKELAGMLQQGIGKDAFTLAGVLPIEGFLALVKHAMLVVTVNTSTVHIAAALQVPQVVLYALTNPQHTPWQATARVLYFPVKEELASKSPVIKYVARQIATLANSYPSPGDILEAAKQLLV